MPEDLLTMSAKEVDRAGVVRRVLERRLSQTKAAELLGVSARQVRRMCRAYERQGARGLISGKRGKPSNNQALRGVRDQVMALVRERYNDFGPTLAAEKLAELHRFHVSKETLRQWMKDEGVWLTRKQRVPRPHQPRFRRECLGELVQIDGCDHHWFEDRGPACSLLVYVDDATGKLMQLRFVRTESAFDYFDATKAYLRQHGRPAAFYSDKHSIFRVAKEGTGGRDRGVTQFGRALAELNIDIICANTPQAKGRVERMNRSLQDRLVKELRLRGISTADAANAFAADFIADYNRRFAREPRNPHDAHRPLRQSDDLDTIFTWQVERRLSRELVLHYKRVTYLVPPTKATLELRGKYVVVHESENGEVQITYRGRVLPYTIFEKMPHIAPGAVVENKHLGATLAVIQAAQDERDEQRLASKKLTLREKDRIREARVAAARPAEPPAPRVGRGGKLIYEQTYTLRWSDGARRQAHLWETSLVAPGPGEEPRERFRFVGRVAAAKAHAWEKSRDSTKPPALMDGTLPPPLGLEDASPRRGPRRAHRGLGEAAVVPAAQRGDRLGVMTAFMNQFEADQKARRKKYNDVANQRARERRLATRKAAAGG
jgi:transposase